MPFLEFASPVLRTKQEERGIHDQHGLINLNLTIAGIPLISSSYTRLDQTCLLWAVTCFLIFFMGQWSPVNWLSQSICWSVLTLLVTSAMIALTHYWAKVEQLRWALYTWVGLILLGLGLGDLAMVLGWWPILIHLCSFWLGMCAIGYFVTGAGLGSRAFLCIGVLHTMAIPIVMVYSQWQCLLTGMVLGGTLFLLAQWQWDMRPPQESPYLTEAEMAFNRQQYQRRHAKAQADGHQAPEPQISRPQPNSALT
jgi:hypothetical protein